MQPKLITIEGASKSGKTTQANLLAQKLTIDGYRVKVIHFKELQIKECNELVKEELEITSKGLLALNYAKLIIIGESINSLDNYDYVIIDEYELTLLAKNDIHYKISSTIINSYKIKQPDICIIMATNDIETKYENIEDTSTLTNIIKENTILASYKNTKTVNNEEVLLINSALNIAVNEELIYSLVKLRGEKHE